MRVDFRHDYIAHSLDKPRSYKPEEVYVPRGEFDALTSYNKEYTRPSFSDFLQEKSVVRFSFLAKDVERAKPIRHDGQRGNPGPFEGDPTYRSESIDRFLRLIRSLQRIIANGKPVEPNRFDTTAVTFHLRIHFEGKVLTRRITFNIKERCDSRFDRIRMS